MGTHEDSLGDMLCTTEEVQFHLQYLDTIKASGPDHISAQMLKGTATAIAPIVTKLFNDSIQSGCFQYCGNHLIFMLFPSLVKILLLSIRIDLAAGSNCLLCNYVRAT